MKLEVIFDTTVFIEESVNEIELELGLAVVLTAFVCWLFLGSLSSTMNVLLAIPMSLLGTIAVIYFAGFTLNTFTLLGLSLAVGLVVDDAVMVMENIFRHAEMGKDRVRAAGDGTKEITFAALAATLAVIAIFLPVVFMSGDHRQVLLPVRRDAVGRGRISYFEAITLAPARCAQMLQTTRTRAGASSGASPIAGFDGALARVLRGPRWALRRPWIVLGGRRAGPRPRRVHGDQAAAGVRAVAGPEPPQRAPHDPVGPPSTRRMRYVRRAEKFLEGRPEVLDVMSNVSPGSGESVRDDGAALPAQDDAGSVLGDHAQGVQLVPGPARLGAGSLAAGVRRREGLAGRVLGARERLEHAGRAGDEAEGRGGRLGSRHRRRHRLPARRAGAAWSRPIAAARRTSASPSATSRTP